MVQLVKVSRKNIFPRNIESQKVRTFLAEKKKKGIVIQGKERGRKRNKIHISEWCGS